MYFHSCPIAVSCVRSQCPEPFSTDRECSLVEVERIRSFRKKWITRLGLGDKAKHIWNWRPVTAGKCWRKDPNKRAWYHTEFAEEYRKMADHTEFATVLKQVRIRALELLTDDFTWSGRAAGGRWRGAP